MSVHTVKCSSCGKENEFDSENFSGFCTHCGEKLTVGAEDLAAVINECESSSRGGEITGEKKNSIIKICAFAAVLILIAGAGIIILLTAFETAVPFSSGSVKGRGYAEVLSSLESAGFENVIVTAVSDKEYKGKYKNGEAVSVTVNGKTEFETGDKFSRRSAEVIVSYYSEGGKVYMPLSAEELCGMDKDAAVKLLKKYGFTAVRETQTGSLLGLIAYHTYQVVSADVDGNDNFEKGARFAPDATVTVNYYMPIK